MALFAGKSPSERNKTIAAIVLGVLALGALYMAFGPSFRSKASSNATSPSPSPSASAASSSNNGNSKLAMPTQQKEVFEYTSTAIDYRGPLTTATDVGRNIFAFYEPPPPTPWQPTPTPPMKTPTPPPPPGLQLAYIMPQSVFAGTGAFRLEVNGDKFTADTKIYFNQSQMPTTFVTAQRLTAEIPASLITTEGPKQVIVQSLDGKLYSNQLMLNVQQAPKPEFTFIGMIGRKRFNNDTAYFQENGKPLPTSARLNDVVGGRFRVVSISAAQTVVEDTSLGFRYKLDMVPASAGTTAGSSGGRNNFPGDGYQQINPQQQNIPGIPNGIPRYVPPTVTTKQPNPQRPQTDKDKKDVDDNDDTDN